jgi:hypothetical protein
MSMTALPVRPAATAPLLVPALVACYLVWGSTYLAIRLALASFLRFSRWERASWWPAHC